ncbi:MAG: hypothetical protein R6V67_12765 [Spirochaetia bacterium]
MRRYEGVLFLYFLLMFLVSVSALFGAEGARVEDTVFLPQVSYVGDSVELRVTFIPEGGVDVQHPSELPVLSWVDFHDVSVVRDGSVWEARIRFTSYVPGTRTLPPIVMGDVVLDSLKIHTKSILDEEDYEFFGIKNQEIIPGTRLAIALVVVVLFFGPVFLLTFTGKIRRGLISFLMARRGKKPYKRLYRALKDLRDTQDQMSSRRFYIVLDDEFRRYLSNRTGSDFRSITSSEFAESFLKALPEPETTEEAKEDRRSKKVQEPEEEALSREKTAEAIGDLMRRCDLVKFGGENSEKRRREADLDTVAEVVRKVEGQEEERRRVMHKQRRANKQRRLNSLRKVFRKNKSGRGSR